MGTQMIWATTHTGLVEECVNVLRVDAARHPAGEVLSIFWQFHVAMTVGDVGVSDGEISGLIICRRRGRGTLGHGGTMERW